jgi:hypothetical protein
MKKIILMLAFVVVTANVIAQEKSFVLSVSYSVVGSNLNTIAVVDANQNTINSRKLPSGFPQLFKTDSVITKEGISTGIINVLNRKSYFKGIINDTVVNFNIISIKTGEIIGNVVGKPGNSLNYSVSSIIDTLLTTLRNNIFDVNYLNDRAWLKYEKTLLQYGPILQDDLELIALANKDVKNLPFSHYNLGKMSETEFKNFMTEGYDTETPASLKIDEKNRAILTINSFDGNGKSLDSLMRIIIAKKCSNLIIDLRNNTGGGAGAALALTKHLVQKSFISGALVTNKWFANHNNAPTEKDFARFANFNGGSTIELINKLKTAEAITLTATVANKTFEGNIFILTNKNTASTCEPFVYGMQYFKRATIVGEKTAGAMLSKIPFDIGNNFMLFLPTADYFTIDGKRLDKVGVIPDIDVNPILALDKVLELTQ